MPKYDIDIKVQSLREALNKTWNFLYDKGKTVKVPKNDPIIRKLPYVFSFISIECFPK